MFRLERTEEGGEVNLRFPPTFVTPLFLKVRLVTQTDLSVPLLTLSRVTRDGVDDDHEDSPGNPFGSRGRLPLEGGGFRLGLRTSGKSAPTGT